MKRILFSTNFVVLDVLEEDILVENTDKGILVTKGLKFFYPNPITLLEVESLPEWLMPGLDLYQDGEFIQGERPEHEAEPSQTEE